jgi:hypothetical protein
LPHWSASKSDELEAFIATHGYEVAEFDDLEPGEGMSMARSDISMGPTFASACAHFAGQ